MPSAVASGEYIPRARFAHVSFHALHFFFFFKQKTAYEIALNILLAGMTIIFVFSVVTIPSYAAYAGGTMSVLVLVALFVTLIPTTIGALLSAIGIAGMDRLVQVNLLAISRPALPGAGGPPTPPP